MTTATATKAEPTISTDCAELLRLARSRVGSEVARATRLIGERYAKGREQGRNPLGGEADDVAVGSWCFGEDAELVGRYGALDLYRAVQGQSLINKVANTISFPLAVKLIAVGRYGDHPWCVRIDTGTAEACRL